MNLWSHVLATLQRKVNRHTFVTWFEATEFIAQDGSTLTVGVPTELFGNWMVTRYSSVVDEALADLGSPETTIRYAVDSRLAFTPAKSRHCVTNLGPTPQKPLV